MTDKTQYTLKTYLDELIGFIQLDFEPQQGDILTYNGCKYQFVEWKRDISEQNELTLSAIVVRWDAGKSKYLMG